MRNSLHPSTSSSLQGPQERLDTAIKILESFTRNASNQKPSFPPHAAVEKIFSLAERFILAAFPQKKQKSAWISHQKIHKEVLRAIDDVQRFHPLVSQRFSEESKSLLTRASLAIQNYNLSIKKSAATTLFHFKKPLSCGHSLPIRLKAPKDLLKTEQVTAVFHDHQPHAQLLTDREKDAFLMKAFSLVRSRTDLFPSMEDTMAAIRKTPIYRVREIKGNDDRLSRTLLIKLEPFPGETVIVKGSFTYDPHAPYPVSPVPGSFELIAESFQSGFPYQSQHTVFALANPLMPPLPYRPFEIPQLEALLEKKEHLAIAFHHKTALFEKFRDIHQEKMELLHSHKQKFLDQHFRLAQAILHMAYRGKIPKVAAKTTANYFFSLSTHRSPFYQLAETYTAVNAQFLEAPYSSLVNQWLNQQQEALFLDDPKKRSQAALQIIVEEVELARQRVFSQHLEPAALEYIRLMGGIFGKAAASLFLQYFSETLESAPPQLTAFAKALQSTAITQFESFLKELNTDGFTPTVASLEESLARDIHSFQKNSPCHPLCASLEKYYLDRFVNS